MRALIAIGLFVAASAVAGGQQAPAPSAAGGVTPAFEVASVRPNNTRSLAQSMSWPASGRFRATNYPLRSLINLAYDLRTDDQLMGAPGWIASERFDVEAIPAVTVPRPQQRLMLQGLLRDRFGLIVRERSVDVPIYALVRARPDAPLPPTMRESTANCTSDPLDPSVVDRQPRPEPPADSPCGGVRLGRGRLVSRAGHLSTLAAMLRTTAGRRVLDRTGWTGKYDFELTWSVDPLAGDDTALANVGLFTAIQELGLRLQPTVSPETGYVIERVQRPTPN